MIKKLFRWFMTGSLMLILILVAFPFLIRMDHYKSELESQLSQLIGRPITIGTLELQMLPLPYLSARGVNIWSGRDQAGELYIRKMSITPDMSQILFAGNISIRDIQLDGLAVNQQLLQGLIRQLQQGREAPTDAAVSVEHLSARQVTVRMDNGKLMGPYRFNIIFTPEYRIHHLSVQRMDRSLRIQLQRSGTAYETLVEAHDWTLPLKPALHFQQLKASGQLTGTGLQLPRLQLSAYDGTLHGKAAITWRQHWQIEGQVQASAIRMSPLIRLFHGRGFSGRFGGKLKVLLRADQAKALLSHPLITGDFTIDAGIIYRDGAKQPLLVFQQLTGNGILNRSGLVTRNTILHAYNGIIQGDTRTRWRPDWSFQGALKARDIEVEKLLAGFQQQHTLAGNFSGQAKVRLAARTFAGLFAKPAIDGHFDLRHGIVYKADLKKASISLSRQDIVGGQTNFRQLSADALINDGRVSLRHIQLKSTILQARGQMTIDQQKQLMGGLEVSLRNTATLVSVPLRIRGSTSTPHLRPTTGALIGGIIGTTVLGPGVGTALGVMITNKVGRLLDTVAGTEAHTAAMK